MRAEGYYWVKYEGEWVVGLYGIDKTLRDHPAVEHWTLPAFIDDSWWHKDEDFEEIDERRIERPEDSVTMIDIDGLPLKVIVDDSIPPDVMVFENKSDGSKTVRISLE